MSWIQKVFQTTKYYSMWEFALLKICLISLGILAGVYLFQFFTSVISFIWVIFIFSYILIMYKTFIKIPKK
ncbi:hypothetical protein BKP35_18055 [Anaerobacillus arseniciselenatis]|uniref:Uncharacterized protein n=1 Tax=Anaerobacillus arseniciselenatis TaxID=85682 RepID=A0A1S2L9C0_9BACI|nr:hypothetical protein BKP35_18055 [Anaerobacillus arseniciselenatis]